jgi:hypothetical protein
MTKPHGRWLSTARKEQKADICQNERQHACQNEPATMAQIIENIGAGEGNRTLVISLEGWMILSNIRNLATKL